MSENKKKLPKVGAKRFGHRSHTRLDSFLRVLGAGGYFDYLIYKENKKYKNNKIHKI